jgi:hypothetical protein
MKAIHSAISSRKVQKQKQQEKRKRAEGVFLVESSLALMQSLPAQDYGLDHLNGN